MRRTILVSGVVVAALMAATGLLPAGAGENGDTVIVVRKTVEGTATGGFTVDVSCTDGQIATSASLNFDASGAPTDFTGGGPWMIAGDAWTAVSENPENPTNCTAAETNTDGADSTSWTCAYENVVMNGPVDGVGCPEDSGTGTGPVVFGLGTGGQVESQTATVHFTNTIDVPEAAPDSAARQPGVIAARPAFTG